MDSTTSEAISSTRVTPNSSDRPPEPLPVNESYGHREDEDSETNTSVTQSPTNSERLTYVLDDNADTKALQSLYIKNVYGGEPTSIYRKVKDYGFYEENMEKFHEHKHVFVNVLRSRRKALDTKVKHLKGTWNQLANRWEENMLRVDRFTELDKMKGSKRMEPSVKRSTRKVMSNFTAGDIVHSEEEFLAILARLEQQEKEAENAAKNSGLAQIPNMILTENDVKSAFFNDQSRLVRNSLDFYHFDSPSDIWTEEQHSIFVQQLLLHGKRFGKIAEVVPGKNVKECVLHYYLTKKKYNYRELAASTTKTRGRRRRKMSPGQRGIKKKSKGSALMVDIEAADETNNQEEHTPSMNEDAATTEHAVVGKEEHTPSMNEDAATTEHAVVGKEEHTPSMNKDAATMEHAIVGKEEPPTKSKSPVKLDDSDVEMDSDKAGGTGDKSDLGAEKAAEIKRVTLDTQEKDAPVKEESNEDTFMEDASQNIGRQSISTELQSIQLQDASHLKTPSPTHTPSGKRKSSFSSRKEKDAASALANLSSVGRSFPFSSSSARMVEKQLSGWDEKEEALILSLAHGMNPIKQQTTPRRASSGSRDALNNLDFLSPQLSSPSKRRASECITPSISKILDPLVSNEGPLHYRAESNVTFPGRFQIQRLHERDVHSSSSRPSHQSFASIHTLAALGEDFEEEQTDEDKEASSSDQEMNA
ncbi:Set3 complex SANT/Myb domain subunit Snt1 [Schizosaccharomyces osmophilus]|uniref:Set3 complex SANT/Myb domain subunit Snt1 n=1 Tax=Schizosaccharomyces osmophilus TaxID=2545709 RepID=A0AAE9WCF0_9SCHI|nr:Set3 complex SANT/Myb domain subunit Snt1 [Schizosaccharomyces osmophilus]WBW73766.1 Set3 complex SANT/Myb domain subunit Snt1 [Schizosaccharomyces osmophilus]